ncbi:MAG: M23 family metallopeptidase [Dietzia sp.]
MSAVVSAAVLAVLVVVPPAAASPDPPRRDLRGPLPGPVSVVTSFDPPAERWLAGHRGVDLAAAPLSTIRAPAGGTVVFAGAVGGRPVLSIDHGAGLRTTYEPVRATVRTGDSVTTGDTVGHLLAGHAGCPVVACLHWGARLASGGPSGGDDDYIDPLSLLALDDRPIRLKPTLPRDGVD